MISTNILVNKLNNMIYNVVVHPKDLITFDIEAALWKCKLPHVSLVGRSVCPNFLKGGKLHFHAPIGALSSNSSIRIQDRLRSSVD